MRKAGLALLALALFAGAAGRATMGYVTEEATVEELYGTWNWVQPVLRDSTTFKGQLSLQPNGTYYFIEYGEGYSRSRSGEFGVYRAVDQDLLYPWIELHHAGAMEQRVFQLLGRDSLLLRQGDSGYAVKDSEVDLFVRAPLDRPPAREHSYDEEPVPVTQVQPIYPEFAREARIQGKVMLDVLVDEEGRVRQVKVVRGIKGLNEAAVSAVKQWTFRPGMKNGLPVAGWVEVPMDFHF